MVKNTVKIRAVCCGALLTGASTGIFSNSIAVFITPVCDELGLTRGSFSLISSITLILSMLSLPIFAGQMLKTNIRRPVLYCSVICSGCILAYSFCQSIWQFYAAAALYGLFVNGITLFSVGLLLRKLGITVGGAISGSAFAAAGIFSYIFLPILQRTVETYGWRYGYRLQAAVGLIILAAALFIMPPAPLSSEEKRSVCFAPLLRQRQTLYAAAALIIANAVNLALFNHSVAALSLIGLSAAASAAVTSRAALFSSVSKPLFGISADKLGLKTAAVILSAALLLTSVSALLLPRSSLALAAFPLLLCLCACSNSIPANLFAAKLYKESDFPAAVSIFTFASTAGSAIGPPLAGAVFDMTDSYSYMWSGCAAASALSGFLMVRAIFLSVGK